MRVYSHAMAAALLLPVMLAKTSCTSTTPPVVERCGPEGGGVCVYYEEAAEARYFTCPEGTRRTCALDGLTAEQLRSLPPCRERALPCPPCPACPPVTISAPGSAPQSVSLPDYEDSQR